MDTTTSGVSQDLINVGNTARRMIKNWGMGSFPYNTLHAHGDARGHGQYDGWGVASPETEREIELEIKKTVEDCLQNVRNLLRDKRKELDQIAHALVEKETLFYKDLVNILEPGKSEADINKEIDTLSERKLVGTPPIVNLEFLPGLTQVGPGSGPSNAENNRLTDLAQPENKDPENFRPEN
jgi:hypothetical protein